MRIVRDALDPSAENNEKYQVYTGEIFKLLADELEGLFSEAAEKRIELAWKGFLRSDPPTQELMHLFVSLVDDRVKEDDSLELEDSRFSTYNVYVRLAFHVGDAIVARAVREEKDEHVLDFALGLLDKSPLTDDEFKARTMILIQLEKLAKQLELPLDP